MARATILGLQVLLKRDGQSRLRLYARRRAAVPCLLGLLGACGASSAAAQGIPAGETAISVQKRPRPELDPIPIRFGSFEVLPSAELRVAYEDNVFATRADKVDDGLITAETAVSARSNWSRHAVSLEGNAALTRGLSQDAEDTETYAAQAAGQFDVGVSTQVSGRIGYARAYEPRGSVGDTTLRGPRIPFNTLELGAQVQHNAGRLALGADGTLERFQYGTYNAAGASLRPGDRDYRSWSTSLRAGYAIGPGVAAFVEGTYNEASYPDETTGFDRSSDGYSLRAGVQFGLTRLIRGRAAMGYQNQRYDDPAFPRIKGLDFNAGVEWNPTQLMTWTLEARRTIQRSPIVGVAGIRQSRYAGKVDYELRRNLILTARLDHTVSDYAGTDRVQKDSAASLGAALLLNRRLRLSAQGGVQATRSDGIGGRRFDRNRVSISLRYTL